MRRFTLTVLASSILLSACSSNSPVQEVGLIPTEGQYHDRMLDALGGQSVREQELVYQRKAQALAKELDRLEDRRRALEGAQSVSELELSAGSVSASDDEALRMTDFAGASQSAQLRLAEEAGKRVVEASLIENDRDTRLMQAEIEANRKLGELDARYSNTIENARTEADRLRLKSELEVERAKAEAMREKALIEAESAHDLSSLELTYQGRISEAKGRAAQVSQSVSQQSQAQRIKVAIASADAQRRVKDDISTAQDSILRLRADMQVESQPLLDELAKLNDRITLIKGQLASVESSYSSKIAIETAKLDGLNSQDRELAAVQESLINEPASTAMPAHVASSQEVMLLEGEFARAKSNLVAGKSTRLANVDAELARKINALSSTLDAGVLANNASSNPVLASASRSADEAAIKAELAVQQTAIRNEARTQIAETTVKTEIAKAQVVAPVVTNRAVYAGEYSSKPQAFAAKESNRAREAIAQAQAVGNDRVAHAQPKPQPATNAPIVVANTFEPRQPLANRSSVQDVVISTGSSAAGGVQPLVVAPAGTSYSVVYTYDEKGSADMFMNYLRAYGINDFTYRYSDNLGKHVLFMGKYGKKEQAAGRVAELNKATSTSNAKIIESDF